MDYGRVVINLNNPSNLPIDSVTISGRVYDTFVPGSSNSRLIISLYSGLETGSQEVNVENISYHDHQYVSITPKTNASDTLYVMDRVEVVEFTTTKDVYRTSEAVEVIVSIENTHQYDIKLVTINDVDYDEIVYDYE